MRARLGRMNIVTFDEATSLLQRGKIGVMPTDTVYGLVASVMEPAVAERFYELKQREQKPGTLIAASTEQLRELGVAQDEINTVEQYWPNPLSAVLTITGNKHLHQGVGTLAMRVVANPDIRRLLETTGPLITSSANQPGEPPATTIDEAIAYFGDAIDFYVDGGTIADVLPSTIIRPTPGGIEVLRHGSITL